MLNAYALDARSGYQDKFGLQGQLTHYQERVWRSQELDQRFPKMSSLASYVWFPVPMRFLGRIGSLEELVNLLLVGPYHNARLAVTNVNWYRYYAQMQYICFSSFQMFLQSY